MSPSVASRIHYTITPEQAASAVYRTALEAELEGGDLSLGDLAKNRINHPLILKYKAKTLGGRD